MKQRIAQFTLVVDDYDTAIAFYVNVLRFELLENTKMSPEKRWVRIRPAGSGPDGVALLLAKAKNEREHAAVGNQTGGRVFLFLETDDFERDYRRLQEHDVEIIRQRSVEAYGTVAVFADPYGNKWDLIQRP